MVPQGRFEVRFLKSLFKLFQQRGEYSLVLRFKFLCKAIVDDDVDDVWCQKPAFATDL